MLQNFSKCFIIVVLMLISTTGMLAQSSANYTFATSDNGSLTVDMNSNPIDMTTGTTTLLAAGLDDTRSALTDIGFNFVFMGRLNTNFSLTENGIVQLGGNTLGTSTYLISANTTLTLLAPFANDMRVGTDGKVHYKVFGSAPNRVAVIEYQNIMIRYTTAAAGTGTWQVRLYENTGAVEYVYGAMATNSATQNPVNVGFGINTTANSFLTIDATHAVNTSGTFATFTPTANSVVTHLHSTEDGSRRYYRFTPPVGPTSPTALNFTGVTNSGMTLNWTDNSSNESGFSVYRSLDDITYTFVANVATDVITYAATGLAPGATYYWRVYAFNEGAMSSAVSGNQATNPPGNIVSAGSGNWNETTTWVGGVVPTATDNVIIGDGHTVTLNATGLVCNALTIGGGTSGVLQYQETPLAGLNVASSIIVSAGGTFTAGIGTLTTHTLAIGGSNTNIANGSLINNGTLDLFTTAGVTTTFFGNLDGTISGSGTTPDFYAIIVNKGTTQSAVLDVTIPITTSSPTTSGNRIIITAGTFKLSSASTLTPWFGSQTICTAAGRLWLNNASAVMTVVGVGTATGAGSPTVAGELRMDGGTFGYGSGNNTLTFTSGTGVLRMSNGTINIFGAISFPSNAGTQFIMSGGNINVDPQAANNLASGTAIFTLGASAIVDWSGGVITIIDPHAAAGGTAWSNAFGAGKNITGGKLRLGDGISTTTGGVLSTTSGFGITNGNGGLFTLEIDNRCDIEQSRMARILANSWFDGLVDIKENGYLFMGSSATGYSFICLGNVINNGTIAGTHPTGTTFLGTLYFQGAVNQTVSGNGQFVNIGSVSLDKADAVFSKEGMENFIDTKNGIEEYPVSNVRPGDLRSPMVPVVTLSNTNSIIANRVNLFGGIINPNGKLTIGRAEFIPVVQVGGVATLVPGSFGTVPLFDNVFGLSTYLYSTAVGGFTMGSYNEMPAGPQTLTQLYINDADGLILDRAITVNSTLSLLLGNITTTNANLLTFVPTTALTGLATSYINGPLARVLPDSLAAGSTYNFPVGKGALKSLSLVDPITTFDGEVIVSAEVFDANSGGTAGTGMLSLKTNRYWYANILSGAANFTSTKVSLTEDSLLITDGIAKSATVNGVYDLVSSISPIGSTITSDDMTSLSYFNIGERFTGPQNPTGVTASAVSSTQINVAFTPNSATNNVVVLWNNTGTFTEPSGVPVVGDTLAGGTVLSNGTTSPVSHTGLSGATTYYYKAFSYDGTDYSLGAAVVNATTFGSVPYTQDFEGTFPPAGWLNYGSKLWTTGSEAHGGLLAARVIYNPAGVANLETFPIQLSSNPTRIRFWWKDDDISASLSDGSGEPEVIGYDTTFFEITTDGGTNWTILSYLSAPSNQTEYVMEIQNLTAYANQLVTFRWRDVSDGTSSAWGIGLDDIAIEEGVLLAPTNLIAVADTFFVTLSWDDNSSNELGFIIERKDGDTASVNPFVVIDSTLANEVSYVDTGLTPSTIYQYRIKAYDLFMQSPYSDIVQAETILPVELTSFAAAISGSSIILNWTTASEINNNGFEIERKMNESWEKIGFSDGRGTTSEISNYSFSDKFDFKSYTGTISYRLKQIDFNGTYSYSSVVNVEADFTPKEYSLYQNYPNPFNPSTIIKYALPFNSNVKVVVYNLLGEVVTELINTVQETGYYDLVWNASNLSSGIYFYTIQAKSTDGSKDFKSVKKMMLVK